MVLKNVLHFTVLVNIIPTEKASLFSFSLGKSNLLEKWVNLLTAMTGFLQKNSVLCIKHLKIIKAR